MQLFLISILPYIFRYLVFPRKSTLVSHKSGYIISRNRYTVITNTNKELSGSSRCYGIRIAQNLILDGLTAILVGTQFSCCNHTGSKTTNLVFKLDNQLLRNSLFWIRFVFPVFQTYLQYASLCIAECYSILRYLWKICRFSCDRADGFFIV